MVTFPLVFGVLFFLSDPSPFQPGYEDRERAFEDPASAFQKLKIIKPRKSLVSVGVVFVCLAWGSEPQPSMPQFCLNRWRHPYVILATSI